MKSISLFLVRPLVAIMICSGPLAVNLQAQSDLAMIVTIPFPFTVGSQGIAAGTYQFSLVSNPFLLSVRSMKTGHQEMFPVLPERQHAVESRGRLIFRKSQDCSVLNEVRFPGTDNFSQVVQRRGAAGMEAKGSSTSNSVSVAQR